MSKRIVVYVLGQFYKRYKQQNETGDKFVAYCDRNDELAYTWLECIFVEDNIRIISHL